MTLDVGITSGWFGAGMVLSPVEWQCLGLHLQTLTHFSTDTQMHMIKMAVSTIGIMFGSAAATTGSILASVPAISESTPVTLALTFGGVGMAAALTWRVAATWGRIENRLEHIENELKDLRKKHNHDDDEE